MNGPSQEGAIGSSQLPPVGRKSDYASQNSNDSIPTQSSSFGQSFRGPGAPWTQNGIWGSNAAASGAYAAVKDQNRSKENTFGSSESASFDSLKGPSSLLPSSQADTWAATQNTPWNQSSSKSPALATIRPTPAANGSSSNSRTLDPTSQPSDSLRSTSPYYANRQIVGQSMATGQGSRKSATLDPTSGSFIAGWTSENNKATSFGIPGDWSQSFRSSDAERDSLSGRSFDGDQDRLGQSNPDDFTGPQRLGTGSSAASRSGSIPPRRNANSSAASQYGMHLGSSLNQQPFPQTSNPLGGGRSFHSPHNSSYSSHSQAPRSDISETDARSVQMAAALGSMYLDSDGAATSFGATSRSQTSQPHSSRQVPSVQQTRPNLSSAYANGFRPFTPEGYPESNPRDYISMQRRAEGLGSASPATSDQLHGLQGPYYSAGDTPPAIGDEIRAPSRGSSSGRYHQNNPNIPQANVVLLERKLRGIQQEQQNQQTFFYPQPNPLYMRADAFRGQYAPNMYDFNSQNAMRLGQFTPYVPVQPIRTPATVPAPPRGPARDQDSGHNLISPLMQEFRSNSKTSKRYELKDIYGHIVEFSGDQHGSRFIQQKLETANSDEKEQVFREIKPNALQLMTDVFGNYVIQKFFEHGNQHQKSVLADQMKGHVLTLSLQMYGCRVVQKALEHILLAQQVLSVKELEANVMKCIKDQNGNHVVQKAIERVPQEHIQFVVEAVTGQVQSLAVHNYGCRVIQRLLEHTNDATQHALLQELHTCTYTLILDPYGNYVVQHIISNGKPEDRSKVIDVVAAHVMTFSKNKCGSNVVERCMRAATKEQLRQILEAIVSSKSDASNSLALMKDQFGNYVIQSILHILKGQQLEDFVDLIAPHLNTLKKFSYGKQIAAIEKIISTLDIPRNRTPPLEASAAPTPPLLSIDAQSPESTSHPSTANSTTDGPITSLPKGSENAPEVGIAAAS